LIRPIITFVIFASGLKYVGVPTTALGITVASVAVVVIAGWLIRSQPWNNRAAAVAAAGAGKPAGSAEPRSAANGLVSLNGAQPSAANGADQASARGTPGQNGQDQALAPVNVPPNGETAKRESQRPPQAGID